MSALDLRRFRRWLESKPPNAVVGLRGSPEFCPVAEHLREEMCLGPTIGVRVDGNTIRVGIRTWETRRWARNFIGQVDADSDVRAVHADEALSHLREVLSWR